VGERSIFVEAVEIADPAERERFLVRACRGDAALRAAVEDLLRWHDAAPAFLDRPAVGAADVVAAPGATTPDGDAADPLLGAEVEGVTLVRLLGEGGFARVYEGEQRHPRRRVAVKVLDPGAAGPTAIARFLRESDILASLDHPGIARVHAAGSIRCRGRALPCFVMELVAGATPIDESPACRGAPLRETLRLFREVCDAVAHAHRKGVVHRDLKPANILVDAAGRPRVIDFGWARLVGEGIPAAAPRTRFGQIIGTAQYMSPEQFSGDSAAVDARADVWALGVILHRLLVGRPPFDLAGKNVYEAATIVRDTHPPPLGRVDRRVPRDLAVIVGCCLEKARDRRYGDAGALADDLGRHLAGQPILASPPGLLDGVWLLARRHPAATAGFAATVAAILAGSAGIAVFAARAEMQRGHAERARQAEAEARAAADVARDRAATVSRAAKRSLYVATTRRLSALAPTADPRESDALLDTATGLAEDLRLAGPAAPPIELAILASRFERAVAALWCPAPVLAMQGLPGDGPVAIGGGDGTVRIRGADLTTDWVDLVGHPAPVSALAVDPAGTRLASAATDGSVILRDRATGAETTRFSVAPSGVDDLAFDAAGSRLAIASRDRLVRVLDADTGRVLAVLGGHSSRIDVVRFRPGSGGRELASASVDGTTILWDAGAGMPRATFRGPRTRRAALAFAPAGDRLAITSPGRGVDLVDTAALGVAAHLPGPAKSVTAIEYSPDGDRLAFVSDDGVVHLWDPRTATRIARLEGHRRRVSAARFSPDGSRLATASWDRTVRLWDAIDGAALDVFPGHRVAVDGVAWPGAGTHVASVGQDGELHFCDAGGGLSVIGGFTADVRSVAFTPGGGLVASAGDGATHLLDVATATFRHSSPGAGGKGAEPVLSVDGRMLATGGDDGRVTVRGVGPATGGRLELPRLPGRIVGMDFGPDCTRLLSASAGGTVRLSDLAEGATVAEVRGLVSDLQVARLLPASGRVAVGGRRGEVVLWDPGTGTITPAESCGGRVRSIWVRPGADAFVTAAEDGVVLFRDGVSGAVRRTLLHGDERPTAIGFSPDGARLAIGDEAGRAWICPVDGGVAVELVGHEQRIDAIAWTPDGTRVATASADRSVRLWDPEDGAALATLEGHAGAVLDVAFDPEGRLMASASADRTVRLWGRPEREIADARAAAP
jgi:WD40 repeat protein